MADRSDRLLTKADRDSRPKRLPQNVYAAFKYGHPKRFGHDLHRQAAWAIGRATFAGLEDEEILELLTMEGNANGAGAWWWDRLAKDGDHMRFSMERKVRRKIATCRAAWRAPILDAAQAREVIGELMDRAAEARWTGPRARSLQKLYTAHLQMALERGDLRDYGASIRQLAIAANITTKTVRATNDELIELGAIRRVAAADGLRSTRYKIVRSWGDKLTPCDLRSSEDRAGGRFVPPTHPAFGHGSGLHYLTWQALESDPIPAREIADRLGKSGKNSIRQARHRLHKLEEAGLAAQVDGEWIQRGDRKLLDRIALESGMTARTNSRRRRYEEETVEHRRDRVDSQKVVVELRRGATDLDELARRTQLTTAECRKALDGMRSRDYALQLPNGQWSISKLVDGQLELPASEEAHPEELVLPVRRYLEEGSRTARELALVLGQRIVVVEAALELLRQDELATPQRGKCWSLTHHAPPVGTGARELVSVG